MSETQAPGGQRSGARNSKDHPSPTPQWRVEGRRPGDRPPVTPNVRWGRIIFLLAVLLVVNRVLAAALLPESKALRVPYTEFRTQVQKGNVSEVSSSENTIEGKFKKAVVYPKKDGTSGTKFRTERPVFAEGDGLYALLQEKGVVVNASAPDDGPSVLLTLLASFGPTLLIFALIALAMRRLGSMGGAGIGGLGRSRARRYEAGAQPRTTFEDVAGIDEAEDELVEIVDFLKNPDKYRKLGATIPKGVLLSGPPGTGKTLLAKAVAGEADVPFFSMSASEFVEMIVGVGASRVRDLFNEAKQVAPAILFIDEIDAIGRARGGPSSIGGHDEREQTLNQILTEMDGFTGSEGVIVLAATNRPEILDQALLRPGRFDRRVVVNPPDQVGREAILRVHTRHVPLAPDVDLTSLASTTPGMVGADLKNLVNEAALLAARRGHDRVRLGDFTDALEKLVLGTERRIVLSREDRERTAYHESGHALLGMLQPGADPVRKISIVPRGGALGVTFQSPDADRYSYDAAYLRGRIIGALGGRAAEEVVYGNVTTGAESDLEMVTRIARQMVGRWGMSEVIGPLSVLPSSRETGLMMVDSPDAPSQETRELVDKETRRIVEECYGQAIEALRANRDKLDLLVHALLEHETLDEADAYRIAQVARPISSAAAAAAAAALPAAALPAGA